MNWRQLTCGLMLVATSPLIAEDQAPAGVVYSTKPGQPAVRPPGDEISQANYQQDAVASLPAANCPTGDVPSSYGIQIGDDSTNRTDWRTADWSGYPVHQQTQALSLAVEYCWREHWCHQDRIPINGAPPAMPPWLYERQNRLASDGVWAPREPDWRSIDWSGHEFGYGVHRATQAHSFRFEEKWVAPAKPSREPWFKVVIHEFIPNDKVCGPGVR